MNNYIKAYREFEKKVLGDSILMKSVLIVAMLGSVADEEVSVGWSDLDILILLSQNKSGNIDKKVLHTLKKHTLDVSLNYNFEISILPHTLDDFERYVSFEYLIHYSNGQCTYPNKKELKKVIKTVLRKRKVSDIERKNYCAYHLRHTRFNLIRKFISINDQNSKSPNKDILKLVIDKMIKVTDLALNYYNIWPKSKREISLLAKSNLKSDVGLLDEAMLIRENWSKFTEYQAKVFIDSGIVYLHDICDSILGIHQSSTPEENMSKS